MIDERAKKQAIKMYRDGRKIDAIVQETGIAKSSLYCLLSEMEIQPVRKPGPKSETAPADLGDLSERMLALEKKVRALEGEVRRLSAPRR